MSEFKQGDRVKVEYEATFAREVTCDGGWAVVKDERGETYSTPLSALTRIADPEPEWREGDVIRLSAGLLRAHTAIRTQLGDWLCSCIGTLDSGDVSHAWDNGYLTILHREGS